jgi:hypothetical protein
VCRPPDGTDQAFPQQKKPTAGRACRRQGSPLRSAEQPFGLPLTPARPTVNPLLPGGKPVLFHLMYLLLHRHQTPTADTTPGTLHLMAYTTDLASRSEDAGTSSARPRTPPGDVVYGPHPSAGGTRRWVPPAPPDVPPRHCPQRGVTWPGKGDNYPDSLTFAIFPLQAQPRDAYSLDQAGQ